MIKQFESVAAFRADYIALRAVNPRADRGSNLSWYNNETEAQTLEKTLTGDKSLVPTAEAMLSQLDEEIYVPQRVWLASPAGARPCVPDALRNIPTSMRRIVEEPDARQPISIYVVSTSSAAISSSTLLRRGTAILALTLALSRIRPISLYTLCALDGRDGETIISARINTDPLDVAQACYTLTSAGFARRLTYNYSRMANDFRGGWPSGMNYENPTPYWNYVKERLAPDPKKSLIIGAAQLGDELLSHPVDWVKKQVKFFTQIEEGIEDEE